jgi:hypothetical protein
LNATGWKQQNCEDFVLASAARLRETPIIQDVSRNTKKICLSGCGTNPLFLTVPATPKKKPGRVHNDILLAYILE